jgi:hypothetical protein
MHSSLSFCVSLKLVLVLPLLLHLKLSTLVYNRIKIDLPISSQT